jgi:hypothetical protein
MVINLDHQPLLNHFTWRVGKKMGGLERRSDEELVGGLKGAEMSETVERETYVVDQTKIHVITSNEFTIGIEIFEAIRDIIDSHFTVIMHAENGMLIDTSFDYFLVEEIVEKSNEIYFNLLDVEGDVEKEYVRRVSELIRERLGVSPKVVVIVRVPEELYAELFLA